MRTWSLALTMVLLAAGCGDSGPAQQAQQDAGPADETPPVVSMTLTRYTVVKATFSLPVTVTDDVGVDRVELLVDGVKVGESTADPFTVDWDTTAGGDGIAMVKVVAYDAAGNQAATEEIPVIVVNVGATADFDELVTTVDGQFDDEMAVPANWTGNDELIDVKYHWTMPDGMTRIVAVLQWDGPDWNMYWSAGTGWCPHSGVKLCEATESDGEIVLDYSATSGTFDAGQWFVHIGVENADTLLGLSMPVTAHVAYFP